MKRACELTSPCYLHRLSNLKWKEEYPILKSIFGLFFVIKRLVLDSPVPTAGMATVVALSISHSWKTFTMEAVISAESIGPNI